MPDQSPPRPPAASAPVAPAAPAVPPPDDKDWTWTLERVCPECGYDAATVSLRAVPALVRDAVSRFPDALGRPGATVRPAPTTWSVLEYACHVRDVCRLFAQRADLVREQDDPVFANWDQDETALQERYWEQDPRVVAAELEQATEVAALAFGRVHDDEWGRRGSRSNGSEFTLDTLARYFLHDLYHHVADIARH